MVFVLAVEGYDGAGKTTLVKNISAILAERRVDCTVIGRGAADSSTNIAAMTQVIKRSDGGFDRLSPCSDMFIRLARTHARIGIAQASGSQVVIFDRFIPYDISRLDEGVSDVGRSLFRDTARAFPVDLTVYLSAEFDVLWGRVNSRSELSLKEQLGRDHNLAGYKSLDDVMGSADFFGEILCVDCTQSEADVAAYVWSRMECLLGV
ncbi:hypothetical protein ACFYM3_15995 [Streptomyces massasporeus]|uniref:Thymidylate kinase-like domain-containing protein n=1 Tax=Streptomyces massasporeus TaxID=67324 RepID=A0ABW6LCD1_9ACTN